jgi:hypothetical protein
MERPGFIGAQFHSNFGKGEIKTVETTTLIFFGHNLKFAATPGLDNHRQFCEELHIANLVNLLNFVQKPNWD